MPEILVFLLLNVIPVGLAGIRFGARGGLYFALFAAQVVCLVGLSWPWLLPGEQPWGTAGGYILLGLPCLLLVAAWLPGGAGIPSLFRGVARRRWLLRVVLMVTPAVWLLGGSEVVVRVLTGAEVLELAGPMKTVMRDSEDWREFTVVAPDSTRIPDPVLFWRPAARPPRSSQGFLGPEVEVPKPPGVRRVLCYGDSNTEGGAQGNWPQSLQRVLDGRAGGGRRIEVLNAGCAGYSSYQGLMRFREEVGRFQPDLVLVSFGWNDLPLALGRPDREFRPPSAALVATQRVLLQYEFYRLLRSWVSGWGTRSGTGPGPAQQPRVPLDDYLANMQSFAAVANEHGAQVLFLTRPHRKPPAEIASEPNWRSRVPEYNARLRDGVTGMGGELFDVERLFRLEYPGEFLDECHFTSKGHDLLGQRLAPRVLTMLGR